MKKYLPYTIILAILSLIAIGSIIFFTLKQKIVYVYDDYYKGYLVSEVRGVSKEVVIPKEYDNKPVVGIGERAFYKNDHVEKIVFEDKLNIIVIKKLAFSECAGLKEIDLSSVEEIERNAFSYAKSLNNINLGCKNLGSSAFYGCESLNTITIANNLVSIGSYAFSKTKIEKLNLPNTLTKVYEDAFSEMKELKEINIYLNKLIDGYSYVKSLEGVKVNNLSE